MRPSEASGAFKEESFSDEIRSTISPERNDRYTTVLFGRDHRRRERLASGATARLVNSPEEGCRGVEEFPDHCSNCEVALTSRFCGSCGQDHRHRRLSYGGLAGDAIRAVTEVDGPFLKTLISLTVRPGTVVKEYLSGKRRRYVNPLKYSFLMGAFAVLVLHSIATEEEIRASISLPEFVPDEFRERVTSAQLWYRKYLNLFYLATLPLFAVILRVLFFWIPLRGVEHFVISLFMYGQVYLYQAAFHTLAALTPEESVANQAFFVCAATAPFIYFGWIAAVVYRKRVAPTARWARIAYPALVILVIVPLTYFKLFG